MSEPYGVVRTERERAVTEPVAAGPTGHQVVRESEATVVVERSPLDVVRRIVWLVFGVLQALLVIRVLLLLLGANEGNAVVDAVLAATTPFVEPFRGMFRLDAVEGASGSVLDIAAIVAFIAWSLVEALALGVIGLADRRPGRV